MVRPPFTPFSEHAATRIYQRNLPHWRQPGATYFVTFRLADALPAGVKKELEQRRTGWLRARGISESDKVWDCLSSPDRFTYRRFVNCLREEGLDTGYGACYLARPRVLANVRSEMLQHDGELYHLGDFVIMPNPIHALIVPADAPLEQGLKQIKGATGIACNRLLGRHGTFWQPDSYDHIARSLEQLAAYRDYIAENPKRAGISVGEHAYYRAEWMDPWFAGAN